jgi:hypothetical protein
MRKSASTEGFRDRVRHRGQFVVNLRYADGDHQPAAVVFAYRNVCFLALKGGKGHQRGLYHATRGIPSQRSLVDLAHRSRRHFVNDEYVARESRRLGHILGELNHQRFR